MEATVSEHAATPTLPDTGSEPELRPSVRERMGIAAFVVVAVVATASWVVLLVWAALQLVGHL
jgi:hypothetical protein